MDLPDLICGTFLLLGDKNSARCGGAFDNHLFTSYFFEAKDGQLSSVKGD